MTACKYWDCGWCYAPNYLKTNAINSTCVDPNKCPISPLSEPVKYEKPMTEIEELKAQIKVLQSKLEFYKELEKTKTPVEEAYKKVYGNYPVKVVSEELTPKDNWNVISWSAFQRGYEQSQKDYKVGEYQETAQEPEEQVSFVPKEIKELVKEGVKWCEEHPDESPLDWLKPQTPEKLTKDKVSLYKRFYKKGWTISADDFCEIVRKFLMDEAVLEKEDYEYITFTLQKSLLEVPND